MLVVVATVAGQEYHVEIEDDKTTLELKSKMALLSKTPALAQKLINGEAVELRNSDCLRNYAQDDGLLALTLIVQVGQVYDVLLTFASSQAKVEALRAIIHLAPQDDASCVAAVASGLRCDDQSVRKLAVTALSKVAERGDPIVLEAISFMQRRFRADNTVIQALGIMAPPGDAQALSSIISMIFAARANIGSNEAAFISLKQIAIPGDEDVISRISSRLEDRNIDYRCAALRALACVVKSGDESAIKQFNMSLKSRDGRERVAALRALSAISPDGGSVIDVASAHMQDINVHMRCAALDVLAESAPNSASTAVLIAEALKDDDTKVRSAAAIQLARHACRFEKSVFGSVIDCLTYDSHWVKADALRVLFRIMQPNASKYSARPTPIDRSAEVLLDDACAIGAVIACLLDHHQPVKIDALKLLPRLAREGNTQVVSGVSACMQTEVSTVKEEAIQCLSRTALPDDANVIFLLLQQLEDTDRRIRAASLNALSKLIQNGDESIANSIARCLTDRDFTVQREAVSLIRKLGLDVSSATLRKQVRKIGLDVDQLCEHGTDAKTNVAEHQPANFGELIREEQPLNREEELRKDEECTADANVDDDDDDAELGGGSFDHGHGEACQVDFYNKSVYAAFSDGHTWRRMGPQIKHPGAKTLPGAWNPWSRKIKSHTTAGYDLTDDAE